MNGQRIVKVSKFLSLVLRHEPEKIGIVLDEAGWVGVQDLLGALAKFGFPITESELHEVVSGNDKKRFGFSDDHLKIRANQGHSVSVELGYEATVPPDFLYHGTVEQFLDSIRKVGLRKGERHHVHMSLDAETALKVGQRRGRPVLLNVRSGQMHRDGIAFFVSNNGVWLTEHVLPQYIEFPEIKQ